MMEAEKLDLVAAAAERVRGGGGEGREGGWRRAWPASGHHAAG